MSTRKAHVERAKRRRSLPLQNAKDRIYRVFTIFRPLVLLAATLGGGWLMIHQLRQAAWHHDALVWILGLAVAATGAVGLYKEIAHRALLRKWLRDEDPARVMEEEPEVRKIVQRLPPWHHPRFVAKRQEARESSGRRTTIGSSRRAA